MVKYVSTYTKGRLKKKKKSAKDLSNDAYVIFFSDFLYKGICCGHQFELHPTTYAFIRKQTKSTLAII